MPPGPSSTRSLAVAIAVATLTTPRSPARAESADAFTASLPARDTARPEGVAPGPRADASDQGIASYRFPITVPAGRNDMAPSLSLDYSSAGALRGGIAVGWTLHVPTIERDPDFPDAVRYRTSLGGGWQRLVPSTVEGAGRFRAEIDPTFARYAYASGQWTVQTPDGTTRIFKGTDQAARWLLDEERDPFGNAVRYFYSADVASDATGFYTERRLERIEWSSNPAAGLAAHAMVDLVYASQELCGGRPIGAALDWHFGVPRMLGARRLTEIAISVRDTQGGAWRPARRYVLGYDETERACGNRTPLRFLTSIQEIGESGETTPLPPVTFEYGANQRMFSYLLGGGFGHGDAGDWRGPNRTMMDLDGDGLLDRAWVEQTDRCVLRWRKGTVGGGATGVVHEVPLPSAAWRSTAHGEDAAGGDEYCTLSGQLVRRHAMTNGGDYCWIDSATVSYHFIDYDQDGLVDLLVNLHETAPGVAGRDFSGTSSQRQEDDPGPGPTTCEGGMESTPSGCQCPPGEDLCGTSCTPGCYAGEIADPLTCECIACTSANNYCADTPGPWGGDGGGDSPSCDLITQRPEEWGSSYAWRVFRNPGDGAFTRLENGQIAMGDAMLVRSPRPLAPNGNEMTSSPYGAAPRPPTLLDVNGDGWLDVVSTAPAGDDPGPGLGDAPVLHVWPGSGGETFPTYPQGWTLPAWNAENEGESGSLTDTYRAITTAFIDANGDRLPDIVAHRTDGTIQVAYNRIGGFTQFTSMNLTGSTSSSVEFVRMRIEDLYHGTRIRDGAHGYSQRLLDIDADGLPEMILFGVGSGGIDAAPTGRSLLRLAGGSRYWIATLDSALDVLRAVIVANEGAWYRTGDFVDVTGDGLPDAVSWASNGYMTVRSELASQTPPRLLARVQNGRGGETRFEYASTASVVEIDAGERRVPGHVVRRIVEAPGAGQPEIQTTFSYTGTAFGPTTALDPSSSRFLGFAKVRIDRSGQPGVLAQRLEKDLAYDLLGGRDGQGRLVAETVLALEPGNVLRRVRRTEHAYDNELLLASSGNDLPSFTFRTSTVERTYAADGLTEAGVRTTTETWTPRPSASGVRIAFTNSETRETSSTSPGTSRAIVRQHQIRAGQAPYASNDYRILETLVETRSLAGTVATPIARTTVTYDNATGLPLETRVFHSATVSARTLQTFDDQTGNLLTVTRPNQAAITGGKATTLAYDDHRLTVRTTTNELGHEVRTFVDVATGELERREGPTWRFSKTSGCGSFFCTGLKPEVERFVRDGLGRVRERWVSTDPPSGGGYLQQLAEGFTYHDSAPVRTIHHRTIRFGDLFPAVTEDEHDGLGRVVKRTERRGLFVSPDAVTYYTYDAGSEVARVDVPDPRVDTGATVPYVYTRDGLGRVTRLDRPDGSAEVVTYDGLATTVREVSTSEEEEEEGARTTTVRDPFDRLARVIEHDNPTPGADATTTYGYDALDRMTAIVDADGVTTTLGYDWAGNRTSVVRGARAWAYAYDLDGNLVEATSPRPAPAAKPEYTSTWTYDALDRIKTHTPAPRGLDASRRGALGIGTITYGYDGSYKGALSSLTLPFGTITYVHDARGQIAREQRTLQLPGFTTTQTVDRTWNALGMPASATWDDGTAWTWSYDPRGLVSHVDWTSGGASPARLATYERSVAGAPRARTSAFDQRRAWGYDALGRVTYDRVWRPSTNATYGERTYGYDGLGELRLIAGTTHGASADATYEYDRRGRLILAQGPLDYDAAFTYTAGGNVATARVAGALDAVDRDVRYVYGAVDPQAVDRLEDVTTGAPIAQLSYDLVGNLRERRVGADVTTVTFDGDDLVREVSGAGGTEIYWFGPNAERLAAIAPDRIKVWFGESETHYTPSGAELVRWHHVAAGEPIARITDGATVELQYADALQNLMLAIGTDHVVAAAFVYGGFGEVVAQVGGEDHRRQFNGKEHDAVSGLRHYGFRSYDPLLLRWISADPLYRFVPDAAWTEPQRANLYAFSLNNPLRYYDPDGRDNVEIEEPVKQKVRVSANKKRRAELEYRIAFRVDGTKIGFLTAKCSRGNNSAHECKVETVVIGRKVVDSEYVDLEIGAKGPSLRVGAGEDGARELTLLTVYKKTTVETPLGNLTLEATFGPMIGEQKVGWIDVNLGFEAGPGNVAGVVADWIVDRLTAIPGDDIDVFDIAGGVRSIHDALQVLGRTGGKRWVSAACGMEC